MYDQMVGTMRAMDTHLELCVDRLIEALTHER
jgi:hypothetical protein